MWRFSYGRGNKTSTQTVPSRALPASGFTRTDPWLAEYVCEPSVVVGPTFALVARCVAGARSSCHRERERPERKERTMTTTTGPDLEAIKRTQQQTWASGDYSVVATRIQLVAEELADAAQLRAGSRVLDVATGSGNA